MKGLELVCLLSIKVKHPIFGLEQSHVSHQNLNSVKYQKLHKSVNLLNLVLFLIHKKGSWTSSRLELFLRFFIAKSKNFTQIAGQDVGIAAAYHILPFSLINEMGKDYLKKLNITLWGALATVYNHCFTPESNDAFKLTSSY